MYYTAYTAQAITSTAESIEHINQLLCFPGDRKCLFICYSSAYVLYKIVFIWLIKLNLFLMQSGLENEQNFFCCFS